MPAKLRSSLAGLTLHVADVERSIAFYELLGLAVSDTHGVEGRLERDRPL